MAMITKSSDVFAAPENSGSFPQGLNGLPTSIYPSAGVLEDTIDNVPASITTDLALSRPSLNPALTSLPLDSQSQSCPSASRSTSHIESQNLSQEASQDNGHDLFTFSPEIPTPSTLTHVTPPAAAQSALETQDRPLKRHHLVAAPDLQRALQSCRHCCDTECPGSNDIFQCPSPCTVPCRRCSRLDCRRGVDSGRTCSFM